MWKIVQENGGRGEWRGREKTKKKGRGEIGKEEGVKREYWWFLDNFRRIGEGGVGEEDFMRVRGVTRLMGEGGEGGERGN